jgi:alpha-beta hydrolase superfamily lysophospholipase
MKRSADSLETGTGTAPRRPLRAGDRAAGAFFRIATRWTGLRPSLVPGNLRRQLEIIGVGEDELGRVLRNLRNLADWPYAWEAEGDRLLAEGRMFDAAAAWYVGQRLLLSDSPLKRRLYRQARELYADLVSHHLERISVEVPAGTVAGYLDLPTRPAPATGFPAVFMLPGVTATKEELHVFAEPLVQRGWAVVRVDNPGYGESTGIFDVTSPRNAVHVMEHMAKDPRLNADAFHLMSMSLGGHCALHSSYDSLATSTTIIAAPFNPHEYLHELAESNITALKRMLGVESFEAVWEIISAFPLSGVADRITIPVRIFHGGRDRTIPVSEGSRIATSVAGPTALTIYERDHHNCLEHFDEIMAHTLEWLDDPEPTLLAAAREQQLSENISATAESTEIAQYVPVPQPGTESA